jgi:hypothetical protein
MNLLRDRILYPQVIIVKSTMEPIWDLLKRNQATDISEDGGFV